ncbi:hypothetical protein MLD38_026732 [Melastoma candidum]|uniref:Uncharacterized protein n=1 Tax=Melastoma candidum TaxID=119954 RepID=A0ACB9NZA6_9MYRT|nr:hypothetical protein MLD38_026732 [Melastoma candidum]
MASLFRVRRREPQIIHPASPTTREYLNLSDLDSRFPPRLHIQILLVYRSNPEKTVDPATVGGDSLARTLVSYYPLAGRIRDQKLEVECNREGVFFVEADADFSVEEIADEPHSSAPYYGELIHNVPGSEGIIRCPLLLVQVTRLKCGGFTVGVRASHVLMDGSGKGQFLKALVEMARGVAAPSVLPVWKRELLSARDPPCFTHKGCDSNRKEHKEQGSGVKKDEVRLTFTVDIRRKVNPALPEGYYGNGVVSTFAVTTAGQLRENPLEYAMSLVRKAKSCVNDEYVRSYVDLIQQKEAPTAFPGSHYVVSDLTKMGETAADFGWGKPVFAIPSTILPSTNFIGTVNYFIRVLGHNGEERVMVPMDMPEQAMERMTRLIQDLQVSKISP